MDHGENVFRANRVVRIKICIEVGVRTLFIQSRDHLLQIFKVTETILVRIGVETTDSRRGSAGNVTNISPRILR